jgi:Dolichyl-phosphate-mannose-protein mannosyltransferase
VQALLIVLAAAFTVAVCVSLGSMVLRERWPYVGARFVVGGALLSLIVFAVCVMRVAYWWTFLGIGIAAIAVGIRAWRPMDKPPIRPHWILCTAFAAYFILYLCHAIAPEASPDGAGYHLGLAARYLREHGFVRITDNMYAGLPAAVEMLFLFAFAFGQHSAAALVHFAFLLALVWQMYEYANRRGFGAAGAAAALLVFASPVVGVDGTSAYNDVAVAAIAFTLFSLIERWREQPDTRLAAAIGLVAGFGFATKYTAWLGVVYAVAMLGWKNRRAAGIVAACAAIVAVPWLVKNWVYLQNPVAPLFNRIFPNPYVMASFEESYRRYFTTYGLASRWQIPLEVTVRGTLSGLLGPVFLLAPIGLLALRRSEGRRLWLAALIFGANYFENIGTRFLIPVIPFLALAMMLALVRVPRLALAIALIHVVLSWPSQIPRYAQHNTWVLDKMVWREALRIKPAEGYLDSHLVGYGLDRLIEERTRPGSTVFTFTPIPEAYTSRHIRVEYQSAENRIAAMLLWTAIDPAFVPTWRVRFAFPREPLRAVRLVQTGTAPESWSIHELRLYDGERELPRAPQWRLTARPYPWTIQSAFDNSLATFWLCGESLRPGQFVEIDFGSDTVLDTAVMEAAPNQTPLRLRLEGRSGAGNWRVLAAAPAISDAPRPLGLRRAVTDELKRRGIDYVLLFDTETGATDFRVNADLWNVRAVGEYKGAILYEFL